MHRFMFYKHNQITVMNTCDINWEEKFIICYKIIGHAKITIKVQDIHSQKNTNTLISLIKMIDNPKIDSSWLRAHGVINHGQCLLKRVFFLLVCKLNKIIQLILN